MNKEDVINKLKEKTGLNEEQCNKINEVLENTFIAGKNNKEKIIQELKDKLHMDDEKANSIYDTAMGIIGGGIMDKLKHPFGK